MVVGFVEAECVVSFMEVEFVIVNVLIDAHVLTKSAYSSKIRSSQFYLLWSFFEPQARCDMGGWAELMLFLRCSI